MRKLGFVALLATAWLLSVGGMASATSVNLRWNAGATTAGALGTADGIGTNSVTIAPSLVATLTLDIRIAVDTAGLAGAFLSLQFDTDLANELNVVSFEEINWSNNMMNTMTVTTPTAFGVPFVAGLYSSTESSGSQIGRLHTFDVVQLDTFEANSNCCPISTTVAFGRVVFTTNHQTAGDDGADVFSGLFHPVDAIADITNVTPVVLTFGTAKVNQIPEPSTLGLLGLGLSALVVAGRRRSRV